MLSNTLAQVEALRYLVLLRFFHSTLRLLWRSKILALVLKNQKLNSCLSYLTISSTEILLTLEVVDLGSIYVKSCVTSSSLE